MKIFGSWSELLSLVFRKNSQAITVRPNQTTTYTASRDIQFPQQDADSVLLSRTSTDTVTNKTLDNTNTVTLKDTLFTLQDDGDATKQARLQLSGITTSTTRTYTLPDANTTVVGTGTTQTLTNKTLDNTTALTILDSNFTMQDNGDNTKQLNFQLSSITSGQTKTLTAPDASTTIVGTDATQTLTNKTISGASNTITNVSLTTGVTGTLPIGNGGSGQVTANAALNAFLPSQTGNAARFLQTDGSNTSWNVPSGAQDSGLDVKNLELQTSVGASALTITLKTGTNGTPSAGDPVTIAFRNPTETDGSFTIRTATAATSLVISSGSTLGHASGVAYPIYIYALDNTGTVELAASTRLYNTERVQSSTAEGGAGAADSANAIYSTTARSNVPMILIGKLISTQTTAGTWAAVPTVATVSGILDAPASNVQGTMTNSTPSAGYLGETISSTVPQSSSGGLTSATSANVTSIVLTPGNWAIVGAVGFNPAATTTVGLCIGAVSQTSATLPTDVNAAPNGNGEIQMATHFGNFIVNAAVSIGLPYHNVKLSTSTTFYLVIRSTFASSTMGGFGHITAFRIS